MAINLTDEEYLMLSRFAYMNFTTEDIFIEEYKDLSIKELAEILLTNDPETGQPRKFGTYGAISELEHREMLNAIVNDEKYTDLANLKLKDYCNQNDEGGFVG